MAENVQELMNKIMGDTALQEKIKNIKSTEDLVAIAKEAGVDLGAADLSKLASDAGALGGIDLSKIGGGSDWLQNLSSLVTGKGAAARTETDTAAEAAKADEGGLGGLLNKVEDLLK